MKNPINDLIKVVYTERPQNFEILYEVDSKTIDVNDLCKEFRDKDFIVDPKIETQFIEIVLDDEINRDRDFELNKDYFISIQRLNPEKCIEKNPDHFLYTDSDDDLQVY